MARFNGKGRVTTPPFAVHEDGGYNFEESDSDSQPVNPTPRKARSGKEHTVVSGSSGEGEASDADGDGYGDGDDGVLSTQFSSLRLNGQRRKGGMQDREPAGKKKTNNEDDTSVNSTKVKARRALGSTQANPLLHPPPSTSAHKGRYSLENIENFRPKNGATWRREEDSSSRSVSSSSGGEQKRGETAQEASKSPHKDGRTVRPRYSDKEEETSGEEFDSLDDFIVDDDEDISYVQDSDDEVKDDDEEEIAATRKTPRRLFRGTRPESVRHNDAGSRSNTIDHETPATAKVLLPGAVNENDLLDLQPTNHSDHDSQGTPIKKFQPGIMETDGGTEDRLMDKRSLVSPANDQVGRVTPPTSPSKSRLQSPSKAKNRIPASPHRPSLDGFWDQKVVNEWNDEHSPQKTPASRRGPSKLGAFFDSEDDYDDNSPTGSPSKRSPSKGSPTKQAQAAAKKAATAAKKEFDRRKVSLAENFLQELDDLVTGGEIQKLAAPTGGVKIIWSKTLNKTAGRANWKRQTARQSGEQETQQQQQQFPTSGTPGAHSSSPQKANLPVRRYAYVELAEKVVDCEQRLFSTLAHEYCHLTNFMISNVRGNPHGASFKSWARKCRAALRSHPQYGPYDIQITTKHSYVINYKYLWRCRECGHEYGRHSKSIDPKKCRCGKCKGKLAQVRPTPRKQKDRSVVENKENRDPFFVGGNSKYGG